jgi:hypothetical protein
MPGGNLEVGKTGHRANDAWFTAVVEGEEHVHAAIGKDTVAGMPLGRM